jgi:hypothetical protein
VEIKSVHAILVIDDVLKISRIFQCIGGSIGLRKHIQVQDKLGKLIGLGIPLVLEVPHKGNDNDQKGITQNEKDFAAEERRVLIFHEVNLDWF